MQRTGLWIVIALSLVNSAAVGWLASRGSGGTSPALTETQVAQMDKLFRIMTEFQQELGTVTAQASYETDEEKATGKQAFQTESLAFSLSKLDYQGARRSRGIRDLQTFLSSALYSPRGLGRGNGRSYV